MTYLGEQGSYEWDESFKRVTEEFPCPSHYKNTARKLHLWAAKKNFTRHKPYLCHDTGFSSIQNCNKFLFVAQPVYGYMIMKPQLTSTFREWLFIFHYCQLNMTLNSPFCSNLIKIIRKKEKVTIAVNSMLVCLQSLKLKYKVYNYCYHYAKAP